MFESDYGGGGDIYDYDTLPCSWSLYGIRQFYYCEIIRKYCAVWLKRHGENGYTTVTL